MRGLRTWTKLWTERIKLVFRWGLARDRELARDGLVMAEGRFLVQRLMTSAWPAGTVFCTPGLRVEVESWPRRPGWGIAECSPGELETQAGFAFHRGILSVSPRPELPVVTSPAPAWRRVALLEGLTNVENLGSLIRSAQALNWDALLLDPSCCDPFNRRVLKVSMGAVTELFLGRLPDRPPGDLAALWQEKGWTWAAAVADPKAQDVRALRQTGCPQRLALALGHEGDGLSQPWIEACSLKLTLPMRPGWDSLNVAVAGALLFWELN